MQLQLDRLPPDALEQELLGLVEYWCSKCDGARLPGRQHLDPLEFPKRSIGQILLFDVCRGDARTRFRFRIASTGFGALTGVEVTGNYLDEIAVPERTRPGHEAMELIVAKGRPVYLAGPPTMPSPDYRRVRRIGLPLAGDGETVDMIIGAFLPERRTKSATGEEAPLEAPILL